VDAANVVAPDQSVGNCSISQLKISGKALGIFMGRAVGVGDSLNTCLTVLLARRSDTI